jgi:hypothetical protein
MIISDIVQPLTKLDSLTISGYLNQLIESMILIVVYQLKILLPTLLKIREINKVITK